MKHLASNIRKTLGVATLLLLQFYLCAQQAPTWNINEEDGIPSLTIFDLHQDQQSYLWFGAENGAFRYDGNNFQSFFNSAQKGRSVTNFQESPDGKLWFTNFHGQLFFYENDSLHHFQALDSIPHRKIIEKYCFDQAGDLWMVNNQQDRILKFSMRDSNWQSLQLPLEEGQEVAYFRDMLEMKDGSIWLYETNTGLWQIAPEMKAYGKPSSEKDFQFKIQETDLGILLLEFTGQTPYPLFLFEQENGFEALPHRIEAGIIGSYRDREGLIWINTRSGIWRLQSNLDSVDTPLPILPNRSVTAVQQDREGGYWFSTLGNGVYFMPSKDIFLYNHQTMDFPDERITCITPGEAGHLFVGMGSGKIVTLKDRKIIHTYQSKGIRVNDILWDAVGKELLVAQDKVYVFKEGATKPHRSFMYGSVKDLELDKNRNLVLATSVYPIITNLQDSSQIFLRKQYKVVTDKNASRIHLRKARSHKATFDRFETETLWMNYSDGLYKNTPEGETKIPLEEGIIPYSFTQTDDSTLWVGTVKYGLLAIKNDSIIFQLQKKDGLINNFCRVLETDGKILWIGTSKGVQTYDPKTGKLTTFNQSDGLAVSEIMDIHLEEDKTWIATPKGLHEMKWQDKNATQITPPIYITSVAIWEKDTTLHEAYDLTHKQNNIKLEFQGLSYRSFDNLSYKYRMLGLDSTWIYVNNNNHFARYPSLPPGDYTFQVKAIGLNSAESTKAAETHLFIDKPYWQKWWFILLTTLGIITLIGSIFWKILRDVQRRNEITQALRTSKLSALRAQMNPHFLFNAINSIQDFILLNDKRQANNYLAKFASLMRLILEMSSQDLVLLEDEIKALKYYLELETLRFEDTMEYELHIDPTLEEDSIKIPPMLIQPHVENAIKHGLLHRKTERRLWVSLTRVNDELLECTVEDNGIGRKASGALRPGHKGFGSFSTKESLRLLNKGMKKQKIGLEVFDLKNDSGEGNGTKVVLSIPFFPL